MGNHRPVVQLAGATRFTTYNHTQRGQGEKADRAYRAGFPGTSGAHKQQPRNGARQVRQDG